MGIEGKGHTESSLSPSALRSPRQMLSGSSVRIWRAGSSQFQTGLTSFSMPGPRLQICRLSLGSVGI